MECSTPTFSFEIFIDNYFTSFRVLSTLEVTTFEQQVCSTKIGYLNAYHWGEIAAKKRNVATLNSVH